jgi:hypothetical protein
MIYMPKSTNDGMFFKTQTGHLYVSVIHGVMATLGVIVVLQLNMDPWEFPSIYKMVK